MGFVFIISSHEGYWYVKFIITFTVEMKISRTFCWIPMAQGLVPNMALLQELNHEKSAWQWSNNFEI